MEKLNLFVVSKLRELIFCIKLKIKMKYVAYSSQGSHTGQLDFCNWLADDSTR